MGISSHHIFLFHFFFFSFVVRLVNVHALQHNSKMEDPFTALNALVNSRITVVLQHGVDWCGRLISFDEKGNIALGDVDKGDGKAVHPLSIIRGDAVKRIKLQY